MSLISFMTISVIIKEEPDIKILTDKEINRLSIGTNSLRTKLDMRITDATTIPGKNIFNIPLTFSLNNFTINKQYANKKWTE